MNTLGHGVIGNTEDSGSSVHGSSPCVPATHRFSVGDYTVGFSHINSELWKPYVTDGKQKTYIPLLVDTNQIEWFKNNMKQLSNKKDMTFSLFYNVVAGALRVAMKHDLKA